MASHEIGHNLGMPHDFEDLPKAFCEGHENLQGKKSCCSGIMDYGALTWAWSKCSVNAFHKYYEYLNLVNKNCIKGIKIFIS